MLAQFNWGEFGALGAVVGAQLIIIAALIKWLQATVKSKDDALATLRNQLVETAQKFNATVVVVFERLIETIEDWEEFLREERESREQCLNEIREELDRFSDMLEELCKEWNIKINGG